jgi:hypothetical protein
MEIIESLIWVLVGFVPTLAGLGIISKLHEEMETMKHKPRKGEVILAA